MNWIGLANKLTDNGSRQCTCLPLDICCSQAACQPRDYHHDDEEAADGLRLALLMSHIHGHFAESIVWKIYVAFKSKICHRHRHRHRHWHGEIVNRCGSFNLTKCAALAACCWLLAALPSARARCTCPSARPLLTSNPSALAASAKRLLSFWALLLVCSVVCLWSVDLCLI